eukprot:scaffold64160_cov65-Phaeocystis_antarctica.AAC.1
MSEVARGSTGSVDLQTSGSQVRMAVSHRPGLMARCLGGFAARTLQPRRVRLCAERLRSEEFGIRTKCW